MKVFLPYMEILRKGVPASLTTIRDAGFDGVEAHLISGLRSIDRLKMLRDLTAQLGLGLRLHQGWSWETGQRNLVNRFLYPLGQLVPVKQSLEDQVDSAGELPVVIYGDSVREHTHRPNYRYQTAAKFVRGMAYTMVFSDFVGRVTRETLPVVFDTQHALEWLCNTPDVTGLPHLAADLKEMVSAVWGELSPFVEEIHLCDFNPGLGPLKGRNLFPGEGVFPLEDFCGLVTSSNWEGVVTPEVGPWHLRGNRLRKLRTKIDNLFVR